MRVIALTPDPLGGFDAIMVDSEGETWYWWYGVSAATVGSHLAAHGTRLIDLSSYMVNGSLVFTAVELGNNNPPQSPVNSESTRVHNYASNNGWAAGYHGEYFISSTPGSKPVIAANSNFRYEPASSIA